MLSFFVVWYSIYWMHAFSSTCCPMCWQRTFCDATSGFPGKGHLRKERRNSTLMTCHYPDLYGASYYCWMKICFNQSIRSTSKVCIVRHHQYQISAIIPQTFFGGTISDMAKCWLFCQATESSKNNFKNSKFAFLDLAASQTQMVPVQRSNITKWPSLGHGFHGEYSLFYCSLFIMQILSSLLKLMAQYTRYYQVKWRTVLFLSSLLLLLLLLLLLFQTCTGVLCPQEPTAFSTLSLVPSQDL